MKIKDLPKHIQEIVLQRQTNPSAEFLDTAFVWANSPELHSVWQRVNNGDFSDFSEPTKTVPTCPSKLGDDEVISCSTFEEAEQLDDLFRKLSLTRLAVDAFRAYGSGGLICPATRMYGISTGHYGKKKSYPASQFLSTKTTPVKQFKRGDKLRVIRLPTKEDWSGGTPVNPLNLSDKCTFRDVVSGREQFIYVDVEDFKDKSGLYYPACCFELVQEVETKQLETVGDLPGWRRVNGNERLEYVLGLDSKDTSKYRYRTGITNYFDHSTSTDKEGYIWSGPIPTIPITDSDITLLKKLNLWPSPDNPEKGEKFPKYWRVQYIGSLDDYPLLRKYRSQTPCPISSKYNNTRFISETGCYDSEPFGDTKAVIITYEQFCNHYYPGEPMYPLQNTVPDSDLKIVAEKSTGLIPKEEFVPRWMRDKSKEGRLEFISRVDSNGNAYYTCSIEKGFILRPWGESEGMSGLFFNLEPINQTEVALIQSLGLPQWEDGKAPTSRSQLQECYPSELVKDTGTSEYLNLEWLPISTSAPEPVNLFQQQYGIVERLIYKDILEAASYFDEKYFVTKRFEIMTESGLPVLYKPKKVTIFDSNIPEVKPINIKLLKRKTS